MACIVLATGIQASREHAEKLLVTAQSRLATFKLPGWVVFVKEIGVTGTHKIQKGQIFSHGQDPRSDPRSLDMREFKRGLRLTNRVG